MKVTKYVLMCLGLLVSVQSHAFLCGQDKDLSCAAVGASLGLTTTNGFSAAMFFAHCERLQGIACDCGKEADLFNGNKITKESATKFMDCFCKGLPEKERLTAYGTSIIPFSFGLGAMNVAAYCEGFEKATSGRFSDKASLAIDVCPIVPPQVKAAKKAVEIIKKLFG